MKTKKHICVILGIILAVGLSVVAFAADGVVPYGGSECPRCGLDGYVWRTTRAGAWVSEEPKMCGHGDTRYTDIVWWRPLYGLTQCGTCGYAGEGVETEYAHERYIYCNAQGKKYPTVTIDRPHS